MSASSGLELLGVSHHAAPVEVRERLAALGPELVLESLAAAGWREAVVLSTCNRFEAYGVKPSPPGARALAQVLDDLAGAPLAAHGYGRLGAEAARHLFEVAAGLDSLVVGEAEILGQVRDCYHRAARTGRTGKVLNVLFQRAMFVGKKVRSETGLGTGRLSVASVAVELAERVFGSLAESQVLVLGAGEMAELTATHLTSARIARLWVANRTYERGLALARRFCGMAVRWEEFPGLLGSVDVVIASTGSDRAVVTRDMVADAAGRRNGRPLFLIDIAMPRDISDEVNELEQVYLYALDDLKAIVAENVARRQGEIARARAIVDGKADEFGRWLESLAAGREIGLKHAPGQGGGRAGRKA
ncbi:MAG: glutamyl-tRNA reductase [Elusimicrobia bacterium]|nr:glutamyl-tRNA reductase [Elusimicrobiota bacterium]